MRAIRPDGVLVLILRFKRLLKRLYMPFGEAHIDVDSPVVSYC